MGLQHIWPLALLIALPVIVVLYMMKQKAKEQPVSSLYLWREVYQNRRSDTPWEKLRHNLLMYLQLLAMGLLVLAMTAPYLTGQKEEHTHPILVLDRSASMGMEYAEGQTRLDVAKEEAIRYVEGLDRDAQITVVAVDDAGTICLSASQNRIAVEQAIRAVQPTELAGDVSAGGELYRSLAALYEDYQIVAYTDTPVDFGDLNGRWVDVADEAVNLSVDMVSHSDGDKPMVMVKVSNHSQSEDYHGDLSLYLEEELLEVQTIDLAHRSGGIYYFEIDEIPAAYQEQWKQGLKLTASISGKDALAADDQAYDLLQKSQEGKVLLVTEQNAFLEQALRANERLTVYRTNVADARDGYDLYLYDGIFPEELPQDGAVLLLNVPAGQYDWLEGKKSADVAEENEKAADAAETEDKSPSGGYLTFGEHEVTRYLGGFRTGYMDWQTYQLPAWGQSYLTDDAGSCVGFLGDLTDAGWNDKKVEESAESGNYREPQMVAVLGIDLHQGDLPLQSQFPIFITQMIDVLLDYQKGVAEELPVFPVTESGVMPSARTEDTVVLADNGQITGNGGLTEALTAGTLPGQERGYSLQNPLLILVLVLLAAITAILVYREVQMARLEHGESKGRQAWRITVPVLRMLAVVLIVLAMADLTVAGSGKGVTTVYLLDVSDSCDESREAGEEFIREAVEYAAARNEQERSAVVAFGGDARVEQFVSEEGLFRQVETSPVRTATNLERAVQTGLALIPEEDAGRLVLLTDGGETEGDVTSMIRGVTERQVAVKVVSLSGETAPENYISQLEVPSDVQVGENFLITVQVESNCSTRAFITLYEGSADGGEKQKATREVELSPGTNQFVFTDTRTGEGLVTYRAVLESGSDNRTVNNQYTAFTKAESPARFLILEKETGESEALLQVLQAAGVQTEVRSAGDAPASLLDLSTYRAAILLDVPVGRLREEFLANLKSYVQDYGGGLIAVGGSSSYALGGWRDTVLEELLPVEMDLEQDLEVPALSMVYVIDKSGSMGSGIGDGDAYDKLAVAKSAAAEAAKNLRAIDRVGVLAFDDQYEWTLKMTDAEDQDEIQTAIGGIQSGGGTSIYPALDAAVKELEKEETKLKHIILLTDGQDSYSYYAALTKRIREAGITLSTVAVGEGSDTKLLSSLAESGQGRFYYSENLSELPDIFAQEVFLSMGEYLVNREFVPVVADRGELLQGVWEDGLYPLLGYVASTPKATSTVYLQSDEGDPILSSIQAGLGRTIAWQSDAVGGWNAFYEGTEEYATLWRNMADWIQTELSDEDGRITVEKEGTDSRIVYETESYSAETEVSVICTDKDGNRTELELTATAPGVYETDVELAENQAYSLFLTRKEGDEVVSGQMTGVAMQYSKEYRFADRSGLEQFLTATTGTEIRTPEQVCENSSREAMAAGREEKSLTLLFLSLAVVAFLADIVLQRFDIHPWQMLQDGIAKLQAVWAQESRAGGRMPAFPVHENKKNAPGVPDASESLLDTSALLRRKEERKRP